MNRKRILVVDDEIGFTRLLKLTLEQTNDYEVRVENWPERALSAAREFRPDLVLLDVVMPRMFGADVAACLRADASLKATPIVFSGFPFLAKPSSVEEVIEKIEQRLARVASAGRTPSTSVALELNRTPSPNETLNCHELPC